MTELNPIQMQKYLKGMDYPAGKQELISHAERTGADENVRAALQKLPEKQYQTAADVSEELGKVR